MLLHEHRCSKPSKHRKQCGASDGGSGDNNGDGGNSAGQAQPKGNHPTKLSVCFRRMQLFPAIMLHSNICK
ncbi:MAG: hypothetical protein WKF36_03490 [Candidatus Nitrosocosmicus sp.]